ncbi:hypothetical protein [Streptomyces albogriseolus]|uniref:hypothetical protein n=1 Tax=Streptomyces albogriseolus TaxID=1887 RepID=UPI0037F2B126
MGKFEAAYGDSVSGIDIRVGAIGGADGCKQFGDGLWLDVARILAIPPDENVAVAKFAGYSYEFGNVKLIVSVYIDDGEPGWSFEKVPTMLSGWSLSEEVETWELAEKLYEGLAALGGYLLIVFDPGGMPITANFGIGDDW